MDSTNSARIADEILRQAAACKPGGSIGPEDVARALETDWHRILPEVRQEAMALARAGRLDILRKGKPVPPHDVKGVIRLRRPPEAEPSA